MYADDGALTGTRVSVLQDDLDLITRLFLEAGLHINVEKTKSMEFPCPQKEVRQRVTEAGETIDYAAMRNLAQACPICGTVVKNRGLVLHQRSKKCQKRRAELLQHPVVAPNNAAAAAVAPRAPADEAADDDDGLLEFVDQVLRGGRPVENQRVDADGNEVEDDDGRGDDGNGGAQADRLHGKVYRPSDLSGARLVAYEAARSRCPPGVAGENVVLPGSSKSRGELQCLICTKTFSLGDRLKNHMQYVHFHGCIFETDLRAKSGWTTCATCGMAVKTTAARAHPDTIICKEVVRRRGLEVQFAENATEAKFTVGGRAIEQVTEFKYLGVWKTSADLCHRAVNANIESAKVMFARLRDAFKLKKMKASTMRQISAVVCWVAMLYGCETWALDDKMEDNLRSAQQRMLRTLTGMMPTMGPDEKITMPKYEDVLRASGATDIVTLLKRRRLKFAGDLVARSEATLSAPRAKRLMLNAGTRTWGDGMHPDWIKQIKEDDRECGTNILDQHGGTGWTGKVEKFTWPIR